MINMKRRSKLRIPDRIAISAALLLSLTAAGNLFAPSGPVDGISAPGTPLKANNMRQEEVQPEGAETPNKTSFRTLLFRHG
jgi:hypothetical protein